MRGYVHNFDFLTLSTGIMSVSAQVYPRTCCLMALLVYTDGNNDATVTVYDNPSASAGTELAIIKVKAADQVGGEVNIKALASTGLYASISGTGATALIRYSIPSR